MIDDFISIGKITSTFGIKGLLKVSSSGDIFPSIQLNTTLYFISVEKYTPIKLLSLRQDHKNYIISLEGFDSIEKSEKLIGKSLYFPKSKTEDLLEKGEYFVHQFIGMKPFFAEYVYNEYSLVEVLENPAHPILCFTGNGTEILVPYINQFVGKVDLENHKIEILNWEDWVNAD